LDAQDHRCAGPNMTVRLSAEENSFVRGDQGAAAGMAMRIVTEMAELMGADRLVQISSAHIDGCLYHGDSGVEFAERLVADGGRVLVPTSLNVGALDLLHPKVVRADDHRREMARRLMEAYVKLGCRPTWTCAPYQAGHRPGLGDQIAWGESNAVAFANSVLGARTNRYGDFFDICCALVSRAPYTGLHVAGNRHATVLVDTSSLPLALRRSDVLYPVLGSWLGATVGDLIAVIDGLPPDTTEDQLKALGAAASSTGAVGMFHVAGVTPEAPDVATALGGLPPTQAFRLTASVLRDTLDRLSTTESQLVDAVAVGSPHFSMAEFSELERLAGNQTFRVPCYVCTSRNVQADLASQGRLANLEALGIIVVVDTCIVVTPILPADGGVLMTNSGKFAHYTPANTGYEVVYGSLADCVASALTGRVTRDESMWS